jgi:hypothetical protein
MKVNAQTPNWTQTYGSAFNDYGYSIEKTYDGGYIKQPLPPHYKNRRMGRSD